jgi:phosphoglycolate phosphatase
VTRPFELACLDMAGTTVCDDGAVEAAFEEALRSVGVESGSPDDVHARQVVHETMGWSKSDVFALLLDPVRAAAATDAFARAYEAHVARGEVTEIVGAREVFRALRARGIRVCLTTGFAPSTREALVDALAWRSEVDLALSPADAGRGRPAPDMILAAMERLGVTDPHAVVVVGDTVSDLQAGSAAGAGAVVGVLSGVHARAVLGEAPHTALIADITDLPGLLGLSDPPPFAPRSS